MVGIYKIINNVNNKVYIGESQDIERRWNQHKENLNNNAHHNFKLQNDWNKYSEENFTFEVLEEIERLENSYKTNMRLIYLEDKYIKEYNSIECGYNIENTMDRILSGDKVIMSKSLDSKYLKWLIENDGMPNDPKKKKKKKQKVQNKKDLKSPFVKELINKGYINDTLDLVTFLSINGIYKKDSLDVKTYFVEKGYFEIGKKIKFKTGRESNQTIITDKGQEFILDLFELEKEESFSSNI